MSDFSGNFGSNPGSQITATRNNSLGNLNLDGAGLPVLFRDTARLGAPHFPATPDYPLTVSKGTVQLTNSVNVFDPDTKTPYSHSWNIGWSRTLGRNAAVEIRYVGTRGRNLWSTVDYNEINIIENRFLDEFKLAQANLQANIAAGRGNTFAFTGAPGTSPLPIYLAHFTGRTDASNTGAYTGTLWSSTNFTSPLNRNNPNPYTPASDSSTSGLFGTPERRANAAAAGLSPNFFLANPGLLGGANIRQNLGYSEYDALQLELRRRFANGFQAQGSFSYGQTWTSDFYSLRRPILESIDTGGEGSVPWAVKADWVYELPFGRGRRWGTNANAVMDRVIGGWAVAGTTRFQSGEVVDLGNVRVVGMTMDEVRNLYGVYQYPQVFTANAPMRIYRFPQDIIENTTRASAVSATSETGYGPQGPPSGRYFAPANSPTCIETVEDFGDCGVRTLTINGPMVYFLDLSAVKRVTITGRLNAEFRGEFLNAFNHPILNGGTTGTIGKSGARVVQLVTRVNW
jgi:hypothetical protein